MSAIITLTTDFGLADAYVAAMKGVILGINPEAKLIDICHIYYCARCAVHVREKCWRKRAVTAHRKEEQAYG